MGLGNYLVQHCGLCKKTKHGINGSCLGSATLTPGLLTDQIIVCPSRVLAWARAICGLSTVARIVGCLPRKQGIVGPCLSSATSTSDFLTDQTMVCSSRVLAEAGSTPA